MANPIKHLFLNSLNFLQVPELVLPEKIIIDFEEIYLKCIMTKTGAFIDYKGEYPKWMLLNYLIENKSLLVHGSNNQEIEVFEPREQTLFNGKPTKAVFAASDGIWSLFFAVINRSTYKGSLRNMCFTVPTKKGIKRYYNFSLNRDFQGDTWCNGTIYFFEKNRFKVGGVENEWICEEEIQPLAKLKVEPEDFPFLHKVKRHNESESFYKYLIKSLVFKK